jgi:TonB family protein
MRQFVHRISALLLFLALVLLAPFASADDNDVENHLKFLYVDNIVTLRHFYAGQRLSFRADGALVGDAPIGPWTLDSQISVKEIHLGAGSLMINGHRIQWRFDGQGKSHDDLSSVEPCSGEECETRKKLLDEAAIEIQIGMPSQVPSQDEVDTALKAIFLEPGQSMAEIVPSFWEDYFAKKEGKPRRHVPIPKEPVQFVKIGEGIIPPKAVFSPDPEYATEARKLKAQGTIVLSLVVDPSGIPRDIQVVRPLGLGLDEKAYDVISTWKFEPAKKDGKPVAAQIMVEVNFRLY